MRPRNKYLLHDGYWKVFTLEIGQIHLSIEAQCDHHIFP